MKGRKLFITLLVVVIAMGLLLSVVACKPPQTPPSNNNNNNNDDDDDDEFDLATMLGDEVNTIVDVVDETVRQALAIDEEAHIGATLFLAVNYAGTEDSPVPPINLDLEIKVEASFDADTQTNNAVLLEITDKTENGLGLIASIFAVNESGNEYVYIGQKAWNSSFTWVKFSQAEEAGLLASFVAKKVAGVVLDIAGMDMSKKDKNGNVTQELTLGDRAEDGLINGLVGDFLGFVPLVAPLEIIMPTTVDGEGETEVTEAGFSVTAATATFAETKVAGGAELKIMVENLGDIIGIAGVLGIDFAGLRTTLDDSGMLGLVNLLAGAVLGQSFDQLFSLGGEEPNPNPLYPKQIAIGVGHNGTVLTGIGLHYDYTNNAELPLKLDLGVKGLVVSDASVSSVEPSDEGFEDADEAAVELSLDVILADEAVDATIKVYAYPTLSINLVELENEETEEVVPFVNLNLVGIKGFATIQDNNAEFIESKYFADFNLERTGDAQPGFKIALDPVLDALGIDKEAYTKAERNYYIPLDAQAMWDDYYAGMTTGFALPESASVIDDIAEELDGGFSIGSILSLLDFVDPIVAELEALVEEGGPISFGFFEREDEDEPADRAAFAEINIETLMAELLGTGGLIADTDTFMLKKWYTEDGTVIPNGEEHVLAYYLDETLVLTSVAQLMNYNTGVAAADVAFENWYRGDYPEATDEQVLEAREAAKAVYFDGDPLTNGQWGLQNIDPADLFTEDDAIRIFAAVTGKTLDPEAAYDDLSLELFASLGASSKTTKEGITISIGLVDSELGTLAKVELNLNIKGQDAIALGAYLDEANTFDEPFAGLEGTDYTDTSVSPQLIWDTILDIAATFAQIEPQVQ